MLLKERYPDGYKTFHRQYQPLENSDKLSKCLGETVLSQNFISSWTIKEKGKNICDMQRLATFISMHSIWKNSRMCFSKTNKSTVKGWNENEEKLAVEWDATETKKDKDKWKTDSLTGPSNFERPHQGIEDWHLFAQDRIASWLGHAVSSQPT